MKNFVMAPMVPVPDRKEIHVGFYHHTSNTKEKYDPDRCIHLTAPKEVWGANNNVVKSLYKHYCFDPKLGQIDETDRKWNSSSYDDERGGARKKFP